MDMTYTFRFDDVSVNTDGAKLHKMIRFLQSTFPRPALRIILAVSPTVYDMAGCENPLVRERTFPSVWHTESDYRVFYKMKRIGIPGYVEQLRSECDIAAHGMAHVDHRLLPHAAQEMSIVMSCSLLNTAFFIPPFHKWNKDTEAICTEHAIQLVKYDRSWRHLVYHEFDHRNPNYYVHTHDFEYQSFCARFPARNFGH